jgi:CheY-like chemotaxis protein
VQDSGTGIPREIVDRIFEPFFTSKDLSKGTGLGLSTSLAIVKSHGGFIRVESPPGGGATFSVYLPAQRSERSQSVPVTPVELMRGSGELILVVDDEAPLRTMTRRMLEAFGYRVALAADGSQAVALYAERKDEIAAVITDMMMPVMDGPSTIRALRSMRPDVRIIATSGLHGRGTDPHEGAFPSVGHFLPKPYTAATLLTALRQVLSE